MSSVASLANTVTPTAFARARPRRRLAAAVPWLLETACVVAAIVVLLPQFDRVSTLGDGRDQRFADSGLVVAGLPEPALPETLRRLRRPDRGAAARGLVRCADAVVAGARGEPAAARPGAEDRACPARLRDSASGRREPGRGAAPAGAGRQRRAARQHRPGRGGRGRDRALPRSLPARCRQRQRADTVALRQRVDGCGACDAAGRRRAGV